MAEQIYPDCKPSVITETSKKKKKTIANILKKISDTCAKEVDCDELNQTVTKLDGIKQLVKLDINENIFGWSLVKTDFEQFSTFLPWLKQSNILLCLHKQRRQACIECHSQFKRLLWSLFSGFEHKSTYTSSEHSSNISCSILHLRDSNDTTAIEHYKSMLIPGEQKSYQYGSFLERFKFLAKITKICPVRLDLLARLHEDLSCGIEESSSHGTSTYRLFATIIVDRHTTKYCRLRTHTVNKEFDTSRLTRLHGEECFLRVNLVQTSKNIDVSCRLASAWDFLDNNYYDLKVNSVAHNVSILVHMMRDLRDSIDQFSGSTVKVENELKQRNVNWLNKGIVNSLADWSALDFDPLEEQALLHENSISLVNNDSTVPNSIDVSNLKIAGKCFQYLTTTSSGVYKNMHIYSVLTYENVQKKMFSDKLLHKHIGYELKLALRMGLWFTPSVSMNLKKVKVRKKDDIEKHTDGCGRISIPVAREMSTRWKEGRKYKNVPFSAQSIGPTAWNSGTFQDSEIEYDETVQQPEYYSAFQVRLDGFKGMLVVDQSLGSKRIIKPSPSQEKFMSPEIQGRWSYKSIEMVQCSQPMVGARLNLALISLIVSCAKDSKDMQAYITGLAIDDLKKRLNKQNRKDAIEFSIKHNDVKSFNMLGAGCPLLETFLAGYYQNYMRRFKIVVEKSRRLFGVADFWHVLTSGEVFVQVSNLKEFSKQKVLVTKEPCFHRGDLRTFTTVTLQDLEKRKNGRCLTGLKDVIVFSCCKHEPPEPEKICGSDLDGDQYFVCWDQNIVGKLRDPLYDASNFDPTKKENLEKVYSSKVTNVAKNLIQREKHYAENIPSESTSSIFKLSSDEEKLLRYHHQPANEFENDVEERKYRLEKCNNLDEVSKVNVIEKSEELDIVTTLMHHKAAMNATNIADNPVLFSVQDIFDIHMRIMDNLKAEWTTDENWKLMEQLCQIIAIVVDSAKSNVMTFKKPVLEDLHLNELPKNPHYDPSKRKNDCKYSSSPLGQIYDALQRELRNDLLGHLQLSDHIDSTDQINHNTLYDEICELKLSFLLHYTKRQYHSDTETLGTNFDESFNTQHQNSDTENHVFNTSLQSIIPRLHIKDIYKWYENEVKPLTNTSLLKKEAACTMLWKVIMLSSLTARSSSRLQIFYLNEQESLIDVGLENVINSIDINCPFLCITQDLYEDLQQISSESFRFPNISSGTFFTIEQHHTALLIERLSILIEKTFWRDLKLPYPDCARLTRLINKDSKLSPVTFDETHSLFEMYSQECLQKPVITGTLITDPSGMDSDDDDNNNHNGNSSLLPNLQEIDICKPNNPPAYVLSKLRDILGCLLCFRETWSSTQSQNCRSALCEKIADISFHQIQMCKYQKVLQEVRDTWESCNKLENLPRCTWNRGRINLSKLEEADTLMQELFKLFLNDVTAETI